MRMEEKMQVQGDTIIVMRDIIKRFYIGTPNELQILNGISLDVKKGEFLSIVGASGSGKSTLMNIIGALDKPTSGQVLIDGHDIFDDPIAAKRCIGYLPEIPPLYPDMTVEEYLRFCAELKKIPKEQRTDQLTKVLALTHLEDMSARLIRNLSKGYKQRVGFAQALLGNPKILILDEPTVGLDPSQVAQVRQLILDLKKDHTIIFSSHILSEVSAVCERVVIINKGEIKAIDTIENLENSIQANLSLSITVEGDKAKVEQLMKMCGLYPEMATHYPHQFSGGQRQRICIARALATDPEFVVCDEAVSALDVSIQAQIINLLKDLQDELKLTYLFISHDLNIVHFISDEIIVMYLGQVVERGTMELVYKNRAHPYTKALFSATPAFTKAEKEHKSRIILQGDVPSPVDPAPGCRFRTRCPYAKKCCEEEPQWHEIEENHFVKCHLFD